jgi:hypothetical protein
MQAPCLTRIICWLVDIIIFQCVFLASLSKISCSWVWWFISEPSNWFYCIDYHVCLCADTRQFLLLYLWLEFEIGYGSAFRMSLLLKIILAILICSYMCFHLKLKIISQFLCESCWNFEWDYIKSIECLCDHVHFQYINPSGPCTWEIFPSSDIFLNVFQCLKIFIIEDFHLVGESYPKIFYSFEAIVEYFVPYFSHYIHHLNIGGLLNFCVLILYHDILLNLLISCRRHLEECLIWWGDVSWVCITFESFSFLFTLVMISSNTLNRYMKIDCPLLYIFSFNVWGVKWY